MTEIKHQKIETILSNLFNSAISCKSNIKAFGKKSQYLMPLIFLK